jgi:ubiquinol-cytochrome c reductase cytochrome c subunit
LTALLARRRHPLALAVALFVALLTVGFLYSVAVSLTSRASAATSASSTQIDLGHKLFLTGCSSCHGLNGEGVTAGNGSQAGPTLIGVGAADVDLQVGTGRMPLAEPNPQAPAKKVIYSDAEIAALAAYVASLGGGPAIPSAADLNYSDADLALGGELFRSNCAVCHNFAGEGGALSNGKYAPNITRSIPKHILEAMTVGPQSMPVFSDKTLSLSDKQAIIAYLNNLSNQPNQGGLGLGRVGPVTEGLVFWIAGIGALVVVSVWIGAKAS